MLNPTDFPADIRDHLIPKKRGALLYRCIGCDKTHGIEKLLYTCPDCGSVLMIEDSQFERLKEIPGSDWRRIFDFRKCLNLSALKGVYLFHEFIGPDMPLEAIVWLGEGRTPVIEASPALQRKVGFRFFFKNEGQNPSASFKDRGMASAFSRCQSCFNDDGM